MSSIDELVRLIDDETLLYRDIKTQYEGYTIEKVAIWSTNEEFLFGFLYDLFDGHVFGIDTVVEVLLLVEEDQVSRLEVVYCNFLISGLPKFKGLKISSCIEDMKNSDYLILHHEVDWGPSEKQKSRMDIIKEQFASLRIWGKRINDCLPGDSKVLLIGDCLSVVRLIIGLYSPDFPHVNIHGITRHYERAAVCLLANKLRVAMREIKGVGVFGEDIVESTNSWIQATQEDEEDETYGESVLYYQQELYQMAMINQKRKGDLIEELERPLKPQARRSDAKGSNKGRLSADPERNNPTSNERDIFPPFGIPDIPEDGPGSYTKSWLGVALERLWLTDWVTGVHDLPMEWKTETDMTKLMNKKPPVKSLRWVVGRLDDEKFHSHTLPRKCKADQSGYSLARGVSDYMRFLLNDSDSPKLTNALVCSSGLYNVPSGIFFSFPVLLEKDLTFQIIQGYHVSETTYMRISEQAVVLEQEYDFILQLYEDFPLRMEEPEETIAPDLGEQEAEDAFPGDLGSPILSFSGLPGEAEENKSVQF